MARDIFISFSSNDQKVADELVAALERRGYLCWISHRNVLPGDNYMEAIPKAIKDATVMIFLYSANSQKSDQVKKELAIAGQYDLTIIPLKLENIAPTGAFLYEFSTRQWIDFFGDREAALESLITKLSELVVAEGTTATPQQIAAARARSRNRKNEFSKPPSALRFILPLLLALMATGGAAYWKREIVVPWLRDRGIPVTVASISHTASSASSASSTSSAMPVKPTHAATRTDKPATTLSVTTVPPVPGPEIVQNYDGKAKICGQVRSQHDVEFDVASGKMERQPDSPYPPGIRKVYDEGDKAYYFEITAYGVAGEAKLPIQQRAVATRDKLQQLAASNGLTLHFKLTVVPFTQDGDATSSAPTPSKTARVRMESCATV